MGTVAWVTACSGIGESGEHLARTAGLWVSGRRKEELERVVGKHHQKAAKARRSHSSQQKSRMQQSGRPDTVHTRPDRSAGHSAGINVEAKLARH